MRVCVCVCVGGGGGGVGQFVLRNTENEECNECQFEFKRPDDTGSKLSKIIQSILQYLQPNIQVYMYAN